MLAYLRAEPGGDRVREIIRNPDVVCYAHSVNLCEVYYDMIRGADRPTAEAAIADLFAAGVIERSDMDRSFWLGAGSIKAGGRISLADCFCIALAQRVDAKVLTSDRREFEPVAARGLCDVQFIR
jgi:PIN domain nuclease of toxin-antitoxin system